MSDWIDEPEAQAWAEHILSDVVPKMQDSAVMVSLVPEGPADVKFAVELGMGLMLDKPVILAVRPGVPIPDKLRRVADAIVEYDMDDPAGTAQRLRTTVDRVMEERGDG